MKRTGTVPTAEERAVLILDAQQLTNMEIAERLGMSVIKVKTLMHRVSVKLGAHSRQSAAHLALMQHYITLDEILSPEDLVEFLLVLDSDFLTKVMQFVCERCKCAIPQTIDQSVLYAEKRQEPVLTEGERNVLILVAKGATNREIAEKLFLTDFAVRNMLTKASSKLHARSRGAAFLSALKQGDILISDVISLDSIIWCLAAMKPESLEKVAQLFKNKLQQDRFKMAGYLYRNPARS